MEYLVAERIASECEVGEFRHMKRRWLYHEIWLFSAMLERTPKHVDQLFRHLEECRDAYFVPNALVMLRIIREFFQYPNEERLTTVLLGNLQSFGSRRPSRSIRFICKPLAVSIFKRIVPKNIGGVSTRAPQHYSNHSMVYPPGSSRRTWVGPSASNRWIGRRLRAGCCTGNLPCTSFRRRRHVASKSFRSSDDDNGTFLDCSSGCLPKSLLCRGAARPTRHSKRYYVRHSPTA